MLKFKIYTSMQWTETVTCTIHTPQVNKRKITSLLIARERNHNHSQTELNYWKGPAENFHCMYSLFMAFNCVLSNNEFPSVPPLTSGWSCARLTLDSGYHLKPLILKQLQWTLDIQNKVCRTHCAQREIKYVQIKLRGMTCFLKKVWKIKLNES